MNSDYNEKRKLLNDMFYNVSDFIHIEGIENIKNDCPNIFVANHNCILDIFLLSYIIPYPCINLISANSLFGINIERKEKLNKLLYPFPIEARGGKNYTDVCIDGAIKLLSQGISLIIFPQGVFDNDGKISKARTGTARILFESIKNSNFNINVIPVALKVFNVDSSNIQSSCIWENFKASATFLQKFDYTKYYNEYLKCNEKDNKSLVCHKIMDDIMKNIAKSLNTKFVDEYIKLYDMDGFYFPDGKYVRFDKSHNKLMYEDYYKKVNSIVKNYTNLSILHDHDYVFKN